MDQTGQLARAITAHRAGRLEEADRLYRRVLNEQPDHAEALHLLGVAAAQRGRHEDAVTLISEAIRISAEVPAYHCNLGNALFEQGLLDHALAAYERALALHEANADAHYNKANVLRDLGRTDAALDSYRRATALRPDHVDAWCNFGAELSRLGRPEEAEACFRKAVQVRADHLPALHGMGDVLRVSGRLGEAKECFEKALRRQPGRFETQLGLGRVLAAQGDAQGAANSFAKALERRPNDIRALRGLGRAVLQLGRTDEAANCFERALRAGPDDVETRVGLAYIRVCRGQAREALDLADGVLDADPNHWDAMSIRSAALAALGRKPEAVAATAQAVKLRPIRETPCTGHAIATVLVLRSMENEHLRPNGKFGFRLHNTNNVPDHLERERFAVCEALVDDAFLVDTVPRLPRFDVVYNAITEPDNCKRSLALAQQFTAGVHCPVINPPERVLMTARDRMAYHLRDWPGPSLCRTVRRRLGSEATAELLRVMRDDGFEFPIIVRDVGSHSGSSMVRLDDPGMLAHQAADYSGREVYVIQFLDCATRGDFYRRLRFFSVDGQLYPSNLHFDEHWNVHGAGRKALMKAHVWMEQQEIDFTSAPAEFIGRSNYDALARLHEAVGLDYFGLDFALTDSGEVVLFEVNAAMSFQAERTEGFPHLNLSYGAIVQAFNDMVLDRVDRSGSAPERGATSAHSRVAGPGMPTSDCG